MAPMLSGQNCKILHDPLSLNSQKRLENNENQTKILGVMLEFSNWGYWFGPGKRARNLPLCSQELYRLIYSCRGKS